ncbi:MAG TPA: CCA tRNA nucleotidyltransferase [Candidatus Hydrogenedentes bacterium]|nr:CCA tRNA nucleotidyltransferase [Candidatus Hydrogenedentota bacterium]HIJ72553.1 CCA tRNA nucleotidyltransferase [Candidatus Hydrogenedentota bacterium]
MNDRARAAERICCALAARGYRALLAGGCVRDLLLGIEPKDYDIATDAPPEIVARLFERTVGVGADFGIQIVVFPEGAFEVATFRRDGPYLDGRHPSTVEFVDEKQDALRRDFTINALFRDPLRNEIVDYVGGQEDLRQGLIRTVGDARERFAEDHLRLLRAVRFAARLDYAIVPETFATICEMAHLITRTSQERIRDEILKMLLEGGAKRAFELMDEAGLLPHVLPEVAQMKGVAQPAAFHPEGDVFEHTLAMLDLMERPSPTLAMAVLLHDAGKPLTQTFEDRIRFNFHDKVGACEAKKACRRLRMAAEETARVGWLVENHMRVAHVSEMRESKRKRFVREEGFPELLELCRLDCLASHRELRAIDWVAAYVARAKPDELRPERLLNGRDLIAMGYTPGPKFSEILTALEDAQLEGRIANPEEAKTFVRDRWPAARPD